MSSPPSEQSPFPRPVVDAWRAGRPVASELQRGYSRFLRRRAPPRSASTFSRWLLGGVLLGAGLAQAATTQPWRAWTSSRLEEPARPTQARGPAKPVSIAPQPSLPMTPSAEPVHTPQAAAAPRKAAPVPVVVTSPSAASFHAQEQWRRAAEGLRTGDARQAEHALLDLERTASEGERDAAKLARAQLLARQGRSREAVSLAYELERSAASSVVRDKARELQNSISKNVAAQRSSAGGAVINQP